MQAAFEDCQATYDPANIAALLQNYPYHIDSLMAMFDLYRVRPPGAGARYYASFLIRS